MESVMKMPCASDASANEDCAASTKLRLRITLKPNKTKSSPQIGSDSNVVSLTRQQANAETNVSSSPIEVVSVKRVRLSCPTTTDEGLVVAADRRSTDVVKMRVDANRDPGFSGTLSRKHQGEDQPGSMSRQAASCGQLAMGMSLSSGDEAVAGANESELASLINKLKREIYHLSSNMTTMAEEANGSQPQCSSNGVAATLVKSDKPDNKHSSKQVRRGSIRNNEKLLQTQKDERDSMGGVSVKEEDVDSKFCSASPFTTEEMNSVFMSDSLDEYLRSQNDKTSDADVDDKLQSRRSDDVDMETVNDVTFFSFNSINALKRHLRHVEHDVVNAAKRRVNSVGKKKKMSDRLLQASLLSSDQPASVEVLDRIDCLIQDGLIRCLEPNVVSGLMLEGDEQFAKYSHDRVVRRASEEELERQPRKGKIYGRKYGRFASKACIDYHVKKRTPVRKKRVKLNNSGRRTGDQFSLVNVTAWQAQQAIMALQLAPSMNNSPIKCRKTGCQPTCVCKPISPDLFEINYDDDTSALPPLPDKVAGVTCQESFCRLGCVCESIRGCYKKCAQRLRRHCGSVDCMLECICTSRKARLRSGRMTLYDGHVPIEPGHEQSALTSRQSPENEAWRKSSDELAGKIRKSGRIRFQPDFSSYQKMTPLIYYDPALWFDEDVRTRKKKVKKTPEVASDKIMVRSPEDSPKNTSVHKSHQLMAVNITNSHTAGSEITIKEEEVNVVDYSSSNDVCEVISCARTSVYTPKRKYWSKSRTKRHKSSMLTAPGTSESAAETLKANIKSSEPQSNVGVFRTNSFLIQNNGKKNGGQNVDPKVFVLEVQSDCAFEPKLDSIVRLISAKCDCEASYPPLGVYHCCGFRVEILPRSLKPVHVPYKPECNMKVESQYSVRIRVTKDRSTMPQTKPPGSHSVGSSKLGVSSVESASLSGFNQLKMMKRTESNSTNQECFEMQPSTTKCKFGPFNQEDNSRLSPLPTPSGGRLKPSILCSSKLPTSSVMSVGTLKTSQSQSATSFGNLLGQPVTRLTMCGNNVRSIAPSIGFGVLSTASFATRSTGPSIGFGVSSTSASATRSGGALIGLGELSTSKSATRSNRTGRWADGTVRTDGLDKADAIDCTVISDVESSDKEILSSSRVTSPKIQSGSNVMNSTSGQPANVGRGHMGPAVRVSTSPLGQGRKLPVLRPKPCTVANQIVHPRPGFVQAGSTAVLNSVGAKGHVLLRLGNGKQHIVSRETFNSMMGKFALQRQQQQQINPIVIEPSGVDAEPKLDGVADAEVANEASTIGASSSSNVNVMNTNLLDPPCLSARPPASSQSVPEVVEVIDSDVDPITPDCETVKSIAPSTSAITMASSVTNAATDEEQSQSKKTFANETVAVKSKRKQLIAQRNPAMEFTEELILISKNSFSSDRSQDETEPVVDATRSETRAKSHHNSKLVAYIRQLSLVLSQHGFLNDRSDANRTSKQAVIEMAVEAVHLLTQKKLSLREEFTKEKKHNEELRRRLLVLTATQTNGECTSSSFNPQEILVVDNCESQATSERSSEQIVEDCLEKKSVQLEHNSSLTHEDSIDDSSKFEQIKVEQIKTEPSSDSVPSPIKVAPSDGSNDGAEEKNVSSHSIKRQLETGKLKISGELLKLLSSCGHKAPIARQTASKVQAITIDDSDTGK